MPTLENINLGAAANDGTGDNLRAGGQKINDNFTALNGAVGTLAYDENNLLIDNEAIGASLNKIDLKFGLTDIYLPLWYGVQWDVTNSSPTLTRIGNTAMHVSLPVQSLMKGCLLLDTGVVNYYLDPTDWSKKADGSASVLDGTDGQVMVELPAHYRKFETDGNMRRVKISPYNLPGFTLVAESYMSAFEASLQRSNLKLSSVINTSTDFRGGNNTSAWDAAANSLLGKPVSSISRTLFRTYARNRYAGTKWNLMVYEAYKTVFWLFTVEYATMNSQLAVDGTLTVEGYKKGGLGNGVSNANSTQWSNFNGQNPFINCGASNSLANGSGEVSVTVNDFGGAGVNVTFTVPRYRGIEHPFGHLWKNSDGVNVKIQSAGSGGESQLWVATNPADFSDSVYTNYTNRGLISRTEGYVKTMLLGDFGDILAVTVGGGTTTWWCDYFYTNIPASGESLRTLFWGGTANSGAIDGLASAASSHAPSSAAASFGSRLCYLP
jgi:hypothetical protein